MTTTHFGNNFNTIKNYIQFPKSNIFIICGYIFEKYLFIINTSTYTIRLHIYMYDRRTMINTYYSKISTFECTILERCFVAGVSLKTNTFQVIQSRMTSLNDYTIKNNNGTPKSLRD